MRFDHAPTCASRRTRRRALLALAGLTACSGDSPIATEVPVAAAVTVSDQQVTLTSLGQTHLLSASVEDQHGSVMASAPLEWSSSNPDVAPVTAIGLVRAVANGSATITATSGSASAATMVTVEQVGVSMETDPPYLELDDVGDAAMVEVTVLDAEDNVVLDALLEWTSSDPGVAEVSPDGLVTATGEGAAAVTATVADAGSGARSGGSAPASISVAVFVGPRVLMITGTQPSPLTEGTAAVIEGVGFSPVAADNVVTLGGIPVQVTAASLTSLDVLVPVPCQPARQDELTVGVLGLATTSTTTVVPASPLDLDVGEGAVATEGCLPLVAGSGGEQYLVGALSTSESFGRLVAVNIGAAVSEGPVVSPPMVASRSGANDRTSTRHRVASSARRTFSVPVEPRAAPAVRIGDVSRAAFARGRSPDHWSVEAEIRRRDRALLETMGRVGSPPAESPRPTSGTGPLAATPSVGEVLEVNVPWVCDVAVSVQAEVRYVGTAGVWLEDVDNPVPSFSTLEYQSFDALLTSTIVPTVASYFGSFEDVDANGRTVVLVTKEANERGSRGFAVSVDLYPFVECPASNVAEIFYVAAPDPDGVHGSVFTKQQALDHYPALISHELTHVSQHTQFLYGSAAPQAAWQSEGGATLAEQLVGFEVLGHGPGQDLGWTEWQSGTDNWWYQNWAMDLARYFGWLGDTQANGAPEQCSWLAREAEGNHGPCYDVRAPYGTPATLLRWVLDEYGPSYPGGETALMRELTASIHSGLSSLTEPTSESLAYLLSRFAAALWSDGRLGDALPSWNLFDIFQNLDSTQRLNPHTSSSAAPSLEIQVRGASSAYLEWSPPSPHAQTSLRLRAQGGGAAPSSMVLWILRIS